LKSKKSDFQISKIYWSNHLEGQNFTTVAWHVSAVFHIKKYEISNTNAMARVFLPAQSILSQE